MTAVGKLTTRKNIYTTEKRKTGQKENKRTAKISNKHDGLDVYVVRLKGTFGLAWFLICSKSIKVHGQTM